MNSYNMKDFQNAIVWSYSRVSSKEQFERNSSIETQVRAIQDFAREHHLLITREFDAAYESSKNLKSQKTLINLIETLKKTPVSKRPKLILLWSPSRFGRSGVEHIGLLSSLRTKFDVRIYAVSSGKHTFDERSEHDFAKELLVAQQENFNRLDSIIPGMKNFVRKGFHLGTAPRGYDKYGPRVTDPRRVQGIQEIKINEEGRWLKKAFKLKIYEDATDKEIIDFMASKGFNIPKQTLCNMWRNPFYAGISKNKLLGDQEIEGNWERLVSIADWKLLQNKLTGSFMAGISKLPGKLDTPLIPKFLYCTNCEKNMTSYQHKKTGNYYYKCNKCNHTVNANSTSRAKRMGMHEKFGELLDGFKLSPKLIPVLKEQVRLVLEDSLKGFEGKRKDLLSQITQKENELENLERRFAVGHIKEKMWKKYTRITQEEIKEIELKLENLPSKKSNLAILDEKILSLLENPRQFWESINTKQKRRLQDVLFPDGLHYSPKTTEYRTSNIHLLLEITGCFIDTWTSEKNKTRRLNVFGSRVVAGAGLEPTAFGL